MSRLPPRWIDRILDWYCHPSYVDEIKGDLFELYQEWYAERGDRQSNLYYFWNLILFLRVYNSKFSFNNMSNYRISLFKHFIAVSARNLLKHKAYYVANILGLALGVGVSSLIYLHVERELSYEKAFPKHDRIFRISTHQEWAKSSPVLGPMMADYFPELESVGRFKRHWGDNFLRAGDNALVSSEVFEADAEVIDIFDLQFVKGSPEGALDRPYTTIVTETLASKLFGDREPVGEVIELNDRDKVEVTGVIEDLPKYSHLKMEMIMSLEAFYQYTSPEGTESKGWMVMYTFALLKEGITEAQFRAKMPDFQNHYVPEEYREYMADINFEVMPLTDIHLHSDRIQEMGENGDVMYIYIFVSLAVIILMVAILNFVNAFTMLLLKRVREVGIRKVIGSSKADLFGQLIAESIFVSLLGFTLGLILACLALPYYVRLTGVHLSVQEVMVAANLMPFVAIALGVGILAGAYPAYLAVNHYWNGNSHGNGDEGISLLRHGLVTFQFALCLCILTGATVVYQQLSFIQNRELGYSTDQLVAVTPYGKLREALMDRRDLLFSELQTTAGVSSMAFVTNLVGESLSMESFYLASDSIDGPDDDHTVNMIWADEYYLETMGISLVAGRNFSAATDSSKTFIVNQKLADRLGGDVVGKRILWQNRAGVIVGVMANYHHYSLHQKIWPTAVAFTPDWMSHLLVRMEGEDPLRTLRTLESRLTEISPGSMVRSTFIDDRVDRMYREENSMLRIAAVFALLAIVISAVGLLGLASLEISRRTKEVGVRKVLGASTLQTIKLLGRQFVWVILLSIAISTPLNYWLADSWLSGFVFQASLAWWVFALPALSVALLAGCIVVVQAFHLANSNPVESLRYE